MSNIQHNSIELRKLSIGYENKILFSDMSFSVAKNAVVAVLGFNGTGKSTLIRTLANLQKPIAGSVLIHGTDIKNFDRLQLPKTLSLVLTGRNEVMQALRVDELLQIARSPYTGSMHILQEQDHAVINEVCAMLQLSELLNKKIYALSDGEAQKVFIARALVQQTPVILLDEPTSHLDIRNKIEIFSLIRELALQQKKTILFASHELDLAIRIADQCLLLNRNGEFLFDTTARLISTDKFEQFFQSRHYTFNKQEKRFDISF